MPPTDPRPQCLWELGAALGEGVVWVPRDASVWCVDILGCALHRLGADGQRRSWTTPAEPGFIFPCRDAGFVCGLRGGLYRFDPGAGSFDLIIEVEPDRPDHRLNDGYVDAAGRLWFGTMHADARSVGGALYSLERGPALEVHDRGYAVTNGPAMSPDGGTLYHTDSTRRTVYAFAHADGHLSDRRTLIAFADGVAPDGMAVDSEGCLWIALFNGWRVERFSPDGAKLDEIRLPCAHVTRPAFGGDDLRTLYITTASCGLDADQRRDQPLAGGLFAARVPVAGVAPYPVNIATRKT